MECEQAYVSALTVVLQKYTTPLKYCPLVSANEYAALFQNIVEVNNNSNFLH